MTINVPPIRYVDLVDVTKLQALMESFHKVIGIANAVIDIDGEVIAHAGWQDACTNFHRSNPQTCRRCIESDTSLAESMTCGKQYAVYHCLNGLVDTASPITVAGQHVANVFTGQFLTSPPDMALFRQQAQQFGYHEASYLEAIARVPVLSLEKVQPVTELYAQLASLLADNGLDRLRQQEAAECLRLLNVELEQRVEERTAELARSESRQRAIIDSSPVPQGLLNATGEITYLNPAFVRTFGYTISDVPSLDMWWQKACRKESERLAVMSYWSKRLHDFDNGGSAWETVEQEVYCKDGKLRRVIIDTTGIDEGNGVRTLLVVFTDVTELKQASAELQRQKEYLEAILAAEPECVKIMRCDGSLEQMNPAGLHMLEAASLEEAQRNGVLHYVDPAFHAAFADLTRQVCAGKPGQLEFSLTGGRGTQRWLETHATPLHDPDGSVRLLAVTRDITERKHNEEAIRLLAFYDRLTGLPNRRLLEDRLQQAEARAQRDAARLALFFIDLDKFKPINDELGHDVGDWLLQQVGQRMQACLRLSDTVARIGGDEFIVLLPDISEVESAMLAAEKIRQALAEPFVMPEGHALHISCSIGVAIYPDHADNFRDLLRFGDEAMYQVKHRGRNAVALSQRVCAAGRLTGL